MPHLPDDEAEELQEDLEKVEHMASYEAMQDAIEAAGQTLEAHRAEFEELMADPQAAMSRARRLFSEERFAPLRYTADDVHRAFEAVGYPSRFREELSEEEMETLVAATVYLADDEDNRFHLARQLMMALPDYVRAGRYLDAWLIQYSAVRMTEVPEESNPFLFAMFSLAFEEWMRQVDEQQEALMRELGVDRSAGNGASVDEVEAMLQELLADPSKKARMESYLAAHPMVRDQVEAELMQLEDEALELLDRDDAEGLYLSPEEVDPWLPVAMERMEPLEAKARKAAERGEWPDPDIIHEMQKTLVETSREMTPAVFTPERIDQFAATLRDYRRGLEEAGEREAAAWAQGALISVERDIPPADNRFLVATCFASLRAMMYAVAEMSADAQEGPASEEIEGQ